MVKKLTIELPEDIYAAMLILSQVTRQSPEEMAAEWVTMAVTAVTGKPLQIAKSMSMRSLFATPVDMPLENPLGNPLGMLLGFDRHDTPSKRAGKRSQAKSALPASNKEAAKVIYQLKVTLKESKPPIWRRIQVPGSITVVKLHRVLQVVMGWEDYHLHQYIVDGVYYGTKDADVEVIGSETVNERGVKLYQIAPDIGSCFVYEYDFGDGWQHQVVMEKLLPAKAGATYPVCLTGKCACPPEDMGGVWGYGDFLQVIRNPSHPEHDEMLEWAGGSFDPEEFDMEYINGLLKRVR